MAPFFSGRHLLQYLRRRLVNHLNAGEIRQVPDLLGQGAVCPLDKLFKAFGICSAGHEANFTIRETLKDKPLPRINADERGSGKVMGQTKRVVSVEFPASAWSPTAAPGSFDSRVRSRALCSG